VDHNPCSQVELEAVNPDNDVLNTFLPVHHIHYHVHLHNIVVDLVDYHKNEFDHKQMMVDHTQHHDQVEHYHTGEYHYEPKLMHCDALDHHRQPMLLDYNEIHHFHHPLNYELEN
jgi:hypothetical protein